MKITDVTLTLFAWESIPSTIYGHHTARPTGKISDVFNYLKRKKGPSLSIEEINKIAARGWARRR